MTIENTSGPVALLRGKFAVFETPEGGIHLVFRSDTDTEDRHFDVPKHIVKMAKAGGNPLAMFKRG